MLGKGLGGLEQVAIDYHKILTLKGHETYTVLRTGTKVQPEQPAKDRYLFTSLPFIPLLANRRLEKLINKIQPDAVLLHGNRPLKHLGRSKSVPYKRIFVAHNYRTKPGVHTMDGVIAVSAPVKNHIADFGYPDHQIHVVNNMTDMTKVERPLMDEQCPTLGMLTRLHPIKGVDIFLHALHHLKQEGQSFKALIAGDGPQASHFIDLATQLGLQNLVQFPGWVDQKAEFFKSIDILAMPSRSEAFPVLVVEALSAGIPLIISDLKGPCSVLTQDKEALIVPLEDPKALADAMKRMVSDPALRALMLEAQAKLANNFTPEAVGTKLTRAIANICQTSS